jgi:hypothetical protein
MLDPGDDFQVLRGVVPVVLVLVVDGLVGTHPPTEHLLGDHRVLRAPHRRALCYLDAPVATVPRASRAEGINEHG